jgi:hypothetical protein
MDDFWSIKIKLLLESYHDTWSLIKFTYFMIYLKSQMISIEQSIVWFTDICLFETV